MASNLDDNVPHRDGNLPHRDGPARRSLLHRLLRSAGSVYGLLVLASIAFCPYFFTGLDQWGRGDWDQFTFRFETPRVAMLRDGQLPLWNPYVNGGNVLLAHPHCPALSPWYLPTLLLGAPMGLRVGVLLLVIVGATGMAALLRLWDVSPAGRFLGGVLLMMSAHFAMHITEGHLEWCVLGLMPWVLWCLIRAERDWRFVFIGALVLASGLSYGSIYIVVIFAPLFCVWALFRSIQLRQWRPAANCAAVMGLSSLLCAVVLLPRVQFLRSNPRATDRHEQVSPAELQRMLLSPSQADFFRGTRDVRNSSDTELARMLPLQLSRLRKAYETERWYRLDVLVETTSDWTDVRFEGFPYILYYEEDEAKTLDITAGKLDQMPLSTEGISIRDAPQEGSPTVRRAIMFARLPEQGNMRFVITRGDSGATKLVVARGDRVLLDAVHSLEIPGDLANHYRVAIPRQVVLRSDEPDEETLARPWYRLEFALESTADWCDVQVVDNPYLFLLEQPSVEKDTELRPTTRPIAFSDRSPDAPAYTSRAILCFQAGDEEDLRLKVSQGRVGTSTLRFRTLEGESVDAVRSERIAPSGDKTFDYVVRSGEIDEHLTPLPMPLRWELNRRAMAFDWHEYGCYVTRLGLALAGLGLVVSFRRIWPLAATGIVAALVSMGAGLPIDFWQLWQLLPMYGSLQVPSRFLAVVVFVMAVCAAFGLDRLGRWAERLGGSWLRHLIQFGVVAAIYVELLLLSGNLFSDIFVCPPRPVPVHEEFAQRYAEDEVRYSAMYSAHMPYLRANSGVLREYENIAVPRGKIRLVSDADYRGEAYLVREHGTARTTHWSMARVEIALDVQSTDRLVLNQNYFSGWKVVRHGTDGTIERVPAEASAEGLVSIAVEPEDQRIEFYYLPDSFVVGAVVSGVTLLGCLGVLVFSVSTFGGMRERRLLRLSGLGTRLIAGLTGNGQKPAWSQKIAWLIWAVVLNGPFLLCHPGGPLIETPLIRTLAVNAVLFLVPGVALLGLLIGRGILRRWSWLWIVAGSTAVFFAVVVASHLADGPAAGHFAWNATWILTNVALLVGLFIGELPRLSKVFEDHHVGTGLLAFFVAYVVLLYGAVVIVPPMEDLDFEGQGTAPGLLYHLEPRLLTDRETTYYYAHPPLLHCYMAGSFLYLGQLDRLDVFEEAWNRVERAGKGLDVEPPVTDFFRQENTWLVRRADPDDEYATAHRITGQVGEEYLVDPPLPERGDRVGVQDFEVQMLYDHYREYPRRLATRTPNLFLSALAMGIMVWWIGRMTGRGWLALLAVAVFATSPEMFVRSVYGGYTAINNFLMLEILLLAEVWATGRERSARIDCLLVGILAGLANQKLVPIAAAVVVWELVRMAPRWRGRDVVRALLHPVAVGFVAGTLLFWIYGFVVSPKMFWLEHVRHHLVDRVTHDNPLGYGNYPTIFELWEELWYHTGFVLLPLGLVALIVLCWKRDQAAEPDAGGKQPRGWREMPGLWALWTLLTGVAFSLIDWRQTKHLMPILLPMHLAPARWAATSRIVLVVVTVLLVGLLLWNFNMLGLLASDFEAFKMAPAW